MVPIHDIPRSRFVSIFVLNFNREVSSFTCDSWALFLVHGTTVFRCVECWSTTSQSSPRSPFRNGSPTLLRRLNSSRRSKRRSRRSLGKRLYLNLGHRRGWSCGKSSKKCLDRRRSVRTNERKGDGSQRRRRRNGSVKRNRRPKSPRRWNGSRTRSWESRTYTRLLYWPPQTCLGWRSPKFLLHNGRGDKTRFKNTRRFFLLSPSNSYTIRQADWGTNRRGWSFRASTAGVRVVRPSRFEPTVSNSERGSTPTTSWTSA